MLLTLAVVMTVMGMMMMMKMKRRKRMTMTTKMVMVIRKSIDYRTHLHNACHPTGIRITVVQK